MGLCIAPVSSATQESRTSPSLGTVVGLKSDSACADAFAASAMISSACLRASSCSASSFFSSFVSFFVFPSFSRPSWCSLFPVPDTSTAFAAEGFSTDFSIDFEEASR